MSTNEADRLDLRQAFEVVFGDERLARIAMEAMPPIDYSQLATKQDLAVHSAELRGDMAELKGEMGMLFAALDGKIEAKSAESIKVTVLTMLTIAIMLGGYVTTVLR